MSASDICHDIKRDIVTFGCYTIGQLPREHPAVTDTTNSDRGLEGAFLGWDLLTPTCWIYSFRMQKPVRMKDPTFFQKDFPFLTPDLLLNRHDITAEEIALMHEQDRVHEGIGDEDCEVETADEAYCTPPTQPAQPAPPPTPLPKPVPLQQPIAPPPPPVSPTPVGVQTRARSRQHQQHPTSDRLQPTPPSYPSKHQEHQPSADEQWDRNPATWTSGAKVPLDALTVK